MSQQEAFRRVGIIGTGEIGRRMGALLRRSGRDVVGYDISPSALKAAAELGVETASGIGDLCARSDMVITCVTDGAALREAACGPGGLVAHLAPGTPVLDTTSAEPWISREVAATLAGRGIPFLDAPVSGGVPAAESGRMNFMVGGDLTLLARLRHVFQPLGPVVTHVGDVGSGHAIKAVNMLSLASSMLATAELLSICAGTTGDVEQLVALLDAGPGASYSTRVHFPRFILPETFASGFTFDLMYKDLSIGIELSNRLNVPLFLMRSTFETYRRDANLGMRGLDNTRIAQIARCGEAAPIDHAALALVATGINTAIGSEAMALGVAAGLAPRKIVEVLSSGSGDSAALRTVVAAGLEGRPSGIRLGDVVDAHDRTLLRAVSRKMRAPFLSQSRNIQIAAKQAAGEEADAASLLALISLWTGQPSLRA